MNIIDEIKNRLTPPYTIDPRDKRILERSLRVFEKMEKMALPFDENESGGVESDIILEIMKDTE